MRCISRQDFPCRGRYWHKVRYNGAMTWPPYILFCSRNRRVFSVSWEHFVGFFICSNRQALHYRGPAGISLGIILRKRQREMLSQGKSFVVRQDFLERKRKVFWCFHRWFIELCENYARACIGEGINLLMYCVSLRYLHIMITQYAYVNQLVFLF